ncbi:hypothetical protein [Azospirillum rugosum]|uniref:Uncharacterized protein n=1 Tax=Azospirillum rugosum TaxID=416170 RepID=A0ABS4SEK7_9PROT|nr:hypothetical protein [Azospirillum rugosum]MBP2290999.1 hypothetical protein [Azospirillum rugosum]MDQ0524937.1 hypothetical protein [Azospirillum rugosum]
MGNSYVDGKVRDALMAAKGSRATAQKLLMAWAVEDPQLMLGIAQPFLKAISAAAIERGARNPGGARPAATGPRGRSAPDSALSKEALANVLSRLGRDPDENEAQPPRKGTAGPAPMRSATMVVPASGGGNPGVTHEKAMMTIAKAFVAKKIR